MYVCDVSVEHLGMDTIYHQYCTRSCVQGQNVHMKCMCTCVQRQNVHIKCYVHVYKPVWKVCIVQPRSRLHNFDVPYIFYNKFSKCRARNLQTFQSGVQGQNVHIKCHVHVCKVKMYI